MASKTCLTVHLDILTITIKNPEFYKHIPEIYPTKLAMKKANRSTSDKETSFLDLLIKDIGSDVHNSVYGKRDVFGFPIVNFPWLSVMFLDSYRMVFTFLSWLNLLGVVLAFWISILKVLISLKNYCHMVTDILPVFYG